MNLLCLPEAVGHTAGIVFYRLKIEIESLRLFGLEKY
jgi:hypothetical protein